MNANNFTLHEALSQKKLRELIDQSDFFILGSPYESQCLAAIEAGAAGCKIVTTDLGALPETCDNWATYVPFTTNRQELVHNYAETLKKEIDNYSTSCYNSKEQSDWFNDQYSWINRANEWHTLLRGINENSL